MAKQNPRARRLGEQIQRELTELLRRSVKDDRIGNVTITAVAVTGDLRTAKVFYLVFGKQGPDPKVQKGLESAAGFLRNALSKSLMIRYTPTLSFELDTSIEHGVRLTQLIDSVNKPHTPTPAMGEHPPAGGDAGSGAAAGDEAALDRAAGDGSALDRAALDRAALDGTAVGGASSGGTAAGVYAADTATPAAGPSPEGDDDGHVIDEGDYIPPPRGKRRGATE